MDRLDAFNRASFTSRIQYLSLIKPEVPMKIDFYALLISEDNVNFHYEFGDTELETVLDARTDHEMCYSKIIEIDFNNLNMFIQY